MWETSTQFFNGLRQEVKDRINAARVKLYVGQAFYAGVRQGRKEAKAELLKVIGDHDVTAYKPSTVPEIGKHPLFPMPCCEKDETRTPDCFTPA